MELTQELLLAALDALMDRSLDRAADLRGTAFQQDNLDQKRAFHASADLHSKRLAEASDLAVAIRAQGIETVTLVTA